MNQLQTRAIILSRTNFGEADRIVTMLTPDYGKLRLMAKGSRKIKSKLAGGIELFSVSDVTFIRGKSAIGTLISTRMSKHYGEIVKDIDRVQLGYKLIKTLNQVTEDATEENYYHILEQTFAGLNELNVSNTLVNLWFSAQLLRQAGYTPNLSTNDQGQTLEADQVYGFDFDTMSFKPGPQGRFTANDIKFLRLVFGDNSPNAINKVTNCDQFISSVEPLINTMLTSYIQV